MGIKQLLLIALIVVMSFIFGTIGFHYIEDWSLFDSFYMTVITLTTVGFGEVHTLSPTGKIFTVFLIFVGLGIVSFSISTMMNYMLNFDFNKYKRDKMQKKINEMNDHTIVCGFGRMGSIVCKELAQSDTRFVVIEKDPDLIKNLQQTNYMWLDGDAASEESLENAGIKRANVLVSMVDNDSDALYISLVGRSYSKSLYIICRANDEKAKGRILKTGANKVVLPTHMTALKVAECVLNPAVEDFLDLGNVSVRDKRIQLADLYVSKDSLLNNATLAEKGTDMNDLIIVGIRKPDKTFIFKPSSDYRFTEGDCLISMGTIESYKAAKIDLRLHTTALAHNPGHF